MPPTAGPRVLVLAGARAAEERLLAEAAALCPPGGPVSSPLRIVVPSHSLRTHVLAALAARRSAWLGLEVATLRGVAGAVLTRVGEELHSGEAALPLLVERHGQRESALARALGGLVDGFAGAVAAVRDLLDAGFREEHLEAALERLEEERRTQGNAAIDRAAALVRVTAAVRQDLAERGLRPAADLLARAAERLADDPERALPARGVLVHGFADATGVATDLLEALVRRRAAVVLLEQPPALGGASPGAWRFGRRLLERLSGHADAMPVAAEGTLATLTAHDAPDPGREARQAVALARQAIDDGQRPERIAVVARDLAPYRSALSREIARLGVPASGSAGPALPISRRARALLELLQRGGAAPAGALLAAAGQRLARRSGAYEWELRQAWLALGARNLAAIASLEVTADIELPVFDRFVTGDGHVRAAPRRVAAGRLAAAGSVARDALAGIERLARPLPLGEARQRLVGWLDALVEDEAERRALAAPLDELAHGPLADVTLEGAELVPLVGEAWESLGGAPLGGRGGGVALLSVTEARGRTFDRLIVLGLARDRFPRPVRSEPFLPDALRARLRDLLPDLPVKSEGHDEERFLFAQLLGAAPAVALLRPRADEDGRPLSPSPLLDELAREGRLAAAAPVPAPALVPALDRAREAALAGGVAALTKLLPAALAEARERFGGTELRPATAARLARFRATVLTELGADPADPRRARLGPFHGFVGSRAPAGDPRRSAPAVTTLEQLARCGWQVLLERLLRLAPPVAGEAEIPALPRTVVGSALHGALERMAPAELQGARTLAEALARDPVSVPWPDEQGLAAIARAAVRRALLEEGLEPELFGPALELEVRALLETVRALDWPAGARPLLGLEVTGEARIALDGGEVSVPFRVDRVELEQGVLVLTDYKTGRALSAAVRATTRAAHLSAALARGERLQLVAYALAAGAPPAVGRLLFVGEGLADATRDVRLTRGDIDSTSLGGVWATLLGAWERGAFLPRLLDDDQRSPWSGCESCAVAVACLQGDSGARLRFGRWLEARRGVPADAAAESAAERLWRLREKRARGEEPK